ncbi:MAG: copper chaperone PCu(A)C [Burkholderiaceae bacterium]|nr:copper chaperone PCu(A)C [Burkholderiaceae bacterium]
MKRTLLALTCGLAVNWAMAADYHAGDLHISNPHARATVPGQTTGAVYFTIENTGKTGDKLLGITTSASQSAELHNMQMDGDIMRMREVGALELPPAVVIEMLPADGYHIMLIGLKKPLMAGQKIPLTLRFEKAGKVAIEAAVDKR